MSPGDNQEARRPSPDALLERAQQETRGRLKIFLGAAPGVGKTYEMLMSGRSRRADGIDVVIGVVETHGRAETEALVDGFEIVPLRPVEYKGRTLAEMDIDAIIARKPALVLVDELAHTNVHGSRHPKRYMDVQDLLEQGIDVYTTLNIQHVESLNDIVAQITRIRVRETVPDVIIDRADDIELIDLTPDDLIKRLNEGKVYVPTTAKRAVKSYFSPGNLTALRELALRRTAERVDQQLLNHMQAHAIPGPWAAGDRVLVCVGSHPSSAALVRYTRRQADRMRSPWTALHVETSRAASMSEEDKDKVASSLRLAEQLGGEATTIPGQVIANDIIQYAAANNVTHIIVGKTKKPRWRELIEGSVAHQLIRQAGDISVHVISGSEDKRAQTAVKIAPESRPFKVWPYALSTLYVAAAVGLGMVIDQVLAIQNVALVFFVAVQGAAVTGGLGPALYASAAGALSFNFFFLEPLYTFTVGDPEGVVAFVFFLVVAFITSNLTAAVQRQAAAARRRARTTEDLYLFSKKLAGTGTLDDVLWAAAYQMASMLKVHVIFLLPEHGELVVKAGYPPDDTLDAADMAAASWAWKHDRPAGRGSDALPGARRLYLPLRTRRGSIGVVGLDSEKSGAILTAEQHRLLTALADQAAVSLERIQLVSTIDSAKLAVEADRLRSALLTSISHDLKTPLAGVMGAAGALKELDSSLADDERQELLATVIEESERLNLFIANLLDMTKLETGAIRPNSAPNYVSDIVGTALRRARKTLAKHQVVFDAPADLPMLRVDPVLFEQVLFNLLDNAAKYAPEGSTVRVQAWKESDRVKIAVIDEGPGIPAEDLKKVFDSFYRVERVDRARAGTGLGLSICKGFVESMDGTIEAANRNDRKGAIFTITMPIALDAPKLDDAV